MSGSATLFRTDVQRDVLRELVLSANGTRTAADLARATGHPASSVAREVARLVDAGVVHAIAAGRRRLLHVVYTDPFMAAVRDGFTAASTIEAERARDVRWWLTAPEAAEQIAAALPDDTDWALRLLCDTVNQIPLVAALDALEEMLAAPGTTGDERWDALLAGRDRDLPDLRLLFARLGITSPAQAIAVTEEVFGPTYPVDRPPVEYLEALAADVLG